MITIDRGKTYLVTGGSGFLGKKTIEKINEQGGNVITIARDEGKLIQLQQELPYVEFLTGDISDRFDCEQAVRMVDGIFHLAAFKHVGIAETQSRECIKSNTIGSLNLLELTADYDLDFNIGISTDKAAIVSGVYGASKFLMEALYRQFEVNYPDTQFRIVRYGNVLYSTGSVLCKWKDLLEKGETPIITEPKATRFFWTIDQAVDLIWDCMLKAENAEPYVPDMKSMKMGDLLQAMINKYSKDKDIKPEVIGLGKGENLHEKILADGLSSKDAKKFTVKQIMELI
jgi:UDP-N-acetylglucosamine 4,6-dehydratase